jgi:hypothetical protein
LQLVKHYLSIPIYLKIGQLFCVGLYFDSPEIDAITGDIKKRIFVGICGSFTENNKPILNGLKEYLAEDGYYHVFTADNFPYGEPRIVEVDSKYTNAYEKSMALVNTCDITIIFFFKSDIYHEGWSGFIKNFGKWIRFLFKYDCDCEVNQSADTEIQELCSKEKRNVIVLFEKGFKFRSNMKGIRNKRSPRDIWWDWDDFTREKIPDCYKYIKLTCHNLILERFVRRDIEKN